MANEEHLKILTRIHIADIVTLMNGVCGILAIVFIIEKNFFAPSLLMCGGMVMDSLDGILAHRFGSQGNVGRYFDSISDSITFCIAPAVMLCGIFYDSSSSIQSVFVIMAAVMYAVCGLLRLARFTGKHFAEPMFLGLPTPAAALGMIVFCNFFGGELTHEFSLMYQPAVPASLAAVLAILMISRFPYPKFKRWFVYLMGAIFAVSIVGLLLSWLCWEAAFPTVKLILKWYVFSLFVSYLLGGPVYERLYRSRNTAL